MKPDVDYINRKQRNSSKFTEELEPEKGDNIDWNYSPHSLGVNEMWEKLNQKINLMIKILLKL